MRKIINGCTLYSKFSYWPLRRKLVERAFGCAVPLKKMQLDVAKRASKASLSRPNDLKGSLEGKERRGRETKRVTLL